MKKALVISFDFPPRRTSAVYRNTHLIKYLVRFGWEPTVLTIKTNLEGVEERELLEPLPSQVRIERTRYLSVSGWENSTATAIRTVGALKSRDAEAKQPLLDRWVRSAGAFIRSCLYFPDDTVGWVPFCLVRAAKLIRKQRYDVVYSMSPPRSSAVVGWVLRLLFGIPWVLEMQDPWYIPTRPVRRRIEHWFLGLMLRRADAVVLMTKGHAEDLEHRLQVPPEKLIVIPNGFEEDDFRAIDASSVGRETEMYKHGYVHLSHFGTIYPGNSGRFFPALEELLIERPDLKDRLRVHMVGFPDEGLRRYILESELREVVELRGFIPYKQTLHEMFESQCLLLFWGDPEFSRLAAAGKTYVYLRTGRPILAVTGQGTVREHMEKADAGWVVDPSDTGAIKATLCNILDRCQKATPLPSARPDYAAQFRWDRLAEDLAEVLNSVVRNGS